MGCLVGQTEERAEELGQSDLLDVALRVIEKYVLDLRSAGGQRNREPVLTTGITLGFS